MRVGAARQKGRTSRTGKRSPEGKLGQHIHLCLCSTDTNCHHGLPDALMSTFRDFGGAQGCVHLCFRGRWH